MTADALGIRRGPPGISEHVAFLPPGTVLRKRLRAVANCWKPRLSASICTSECLVGEETWVGSQQHCVQQGYQTLAHFRTPRGLIKTQILFSCLKVPKSCLGWSWWFALTDTDTGAIFWETLLYALPYFFFFSYRIYLSQLLVSVTASIVFLFLSLIGSSDSSFLWCWLWLTGKLLSAGLENSLLFPVKAAYQEKVLNFIKYFSSNYCDNHVFFSIYSNYQI